MRHENKELKDQLSQIAPMKSQLEQLAKVFAPDAGESGEDATKATLDAIQQRLDEADRARDCERLARTHGLTSDDDVTMLASIPDPATREAVAKRLSESSASTEPTNGRRIPGPDRSAGSGSGGGKPAASVGSGRDLFRETHK